MNMSESRKSVTYIKTPIAVHYDYTVGVGMSIEETIEKLPTGGTVNTKYVKALLPGMAADLSGIVRRWGGGGCGREGKGVGKFSEAESMT